MLTANWGRQGPSLVMGAMPKPGPTIDELGLSARVDNALRRNYHNHWGKGSGYELPAPPLSWLREVMARPESRRNLAHVGRRGYWEIREALEGYDG